MGTLDGVSTLLHLVRGGQIAEPHVTPYEVLTDAPHRELRRYGDADEVAAARAAGGTPVLLVPPFAVSASCYDLAADLSLVQHLLDTGRIPYVVDFGDMGRADRHLGFEDFFVDIVPGALAEVCDDFGTDAVDLVGWSLGGTIAFLAVANDPELPVRSITAIGTPLDYQAIAPYPLVKKLMAPIDGKPIGWLLGALGGIPAPAVRLAYRATSWDRELRKPGYIIRNATDTDALTRMQAIDRFQDTMPGYPGKVSVQMWENLIVRDELSGGVLHFGDRTVDLTTITQPIQLFGSHRDAIVSHAAVEHGTELFTGAERVEFTTVETSHLGLVAGAAAVGQTWPRMDEFWCSVDESAGVEPRATRQGAVSVQS